MKVSISPALKAAIEVIEALRPAPELRPEQDPRLVALRQLHQLNLDTLKTAELAEHNAKMVRMRAMAAVAETQVRIEILEQEIGIPESEYGGTESCA